MNQQATVDFLWVQWSAVCTSLPGIHKQKIKSCFDALVQPYTGPGRYYHNLLHIQALVQLWQHYRTYLEDDRAVLLSIFYHDVVYEAGRRDNEQQSAAVAREALTSLGGDNKLIEIVNAFITATQDHYAHIAVNNDLAFFLDFDLSILAAAPHTYQQYIQNMRKEYVYLSDEAFVRGRRTFILKVLQQQHLFFTQPFQQQEEQARQNLQRELDLFRHV